MQAALLVSRSIAAMPTFLPAPVPRLSMTAVSQLPPTASPMEASRELLAVGGLDVAGLELADLSVAGLEACVGGRDRRDDLVDGAERDAEEEATGRCFFETGRRGSKGMLRDVVEAANSEGSEGPRRRDVVAREASMLEGRCLALAGCVGSLKV